MSEMAERVGNAVAKCISDWLTSGKAGFYADELGRVAIQAMREPTDAMFKTGLDKMNEDDESIDLDPIWKSMIDEALK